MTTSNVELLESSATLQGLRACGFSRPRRYTWLEWRLAVLTVGRVRGDHARTTRASSRRNGARSEQHRHPQGGKREQEHEDHHLDEPVLSPCSRDHPDEAHSPYEDRRGRSFHASARSNQSKTTDIAAG